MMQRQYCKTFAGNQEQFLLGGTKLVLIHWLGAKTGGSLARFHAFLQDSPVCQVQAKSTYSVERVLSSYDGLFLITKRALVRMGRDLCKDSRASPSHLDILCKAHSPLLGAETVLSSQKVDHRRFKSCRSTKIVDISKPNAVTFPRRYDVVPLEYFLAEGSALE